jgi:predicted ATPase/transcriptional regulator with GAF, ATPase, and Fis domain
MLLPGHDGLEPLIRIGAHVLVRARRSGTDTRVLLKAPARHPPRAADIVALEREYALLRDLPADGVIRVHALVRAGGTAYLSMEDRGLVPAAALLERGVVDLSIVLRLTVRVCAALGELHRRGLVYGAISPSSIFVAADGNDAQLVDFSQAFHARPDGRPAQPGSALGGGVTAYISPEQTGRMNRSVDHRSDFYSLGATLYALLTGSPPFESGDPLALVHAHIARTPPLPSGVVATLPETLSRIVMRLLSKAAEDRYQSTDALVRDVERCAAEWNAGGAISSFDLGQHDVSDRFVVPQRLYGRDHEIAELAATFDEVCAGATALVLVSGYSGVGKTALIQELYRPIVRERGYFISGKFDQVVRSVPYGGLAQAFRGLAWQLLAEPEERLAGWRQRIATAVGANGGILTDVVPEIELIIGRQPAAQGLDPADAQNRLRYVFQEFVGALAAAGYPLVVFLDDLQWADAATLDLLDALLTTRDLRHLLWVGAYRSNEVHADHPLVAALGRIDASGAAVRRLPLGPLERPDLERFVADALHGDPESTARLAELLVAKTQGNPFFAIQFLTALHDDGLITFDRERGHWSFDTGAVAAAGVTDNVVALLADRIQRLEPECQQLLMLAACIGNPFDSDTLLTVSRRPPESAERDLAAAVAAGLVRAVDDASGSGDGPAAPPAYAFLHDRVQQAAYNLIPEAQRPAAHAEVGRSLLARFAGDPPEERLFEIVNHLNAGGDAAAAVVDRLTLVRLNLAAGTRAKASAASVAAIGYLEHAMRLVVEDDWRAGDGLAFAVHLAAAECLYLGGRFDAAERWLAELLPRARSRRERALVHRLQVVLFENLSRYADAVASGRQGLALFDVTLPEAPGDAEAGLEAEMAVIERLLEGRSIAALALLPRMEDEDVRTVMRILTSLWAPAYLSGNRPLTGLISARMVRLSLVHGITEDSAYGFVTHAITVGPVRGQYEVAFEWGELAVTVNERLGDTRRRAKIQQQFHAHVKLWRRPFEACVPHAREARRSGLETGDFTYAGYGAVTETWPAFVASRNLDRFVREYAPVGGLLEKIRMADFREALQVMVNWALALQDNTAAAGSLSDGRFDERAYLARFEGSPFFLSFLYTARLHLAVLLGDVPRAMQAAREARATVVGGTIWPVLVDFWGGLAATAAWEQGGPDDRARWSADLAPAQASLARLAESCPENYRCFSLVLSAEVHRVHGRPESAIRTLEDAIAYARTTGNLQQEALASELCARLLLGRDRPRGLACLRQAYHCYAEWGASAKLAELDARYAAWLTPSPSAVAVAEPGETDAAPRDDGSLDLATVIKVAQAIAGEIELDGLLRRLMQLALENAGAERGVFVRARRGQLVIEAEATPDREDVRLPQPVACDERQLAASVVRYVHRTGRAVVTGNASADERFSADPYVGAMPAVSILCVPIGRHGATGGVLYLENTLAADAFTADRVALMGVLAAQAAISLENAELYGEMKREVARRTEAEQQLRDALAELERLKERLQAENVYLQEEISTEHNFNEIVGNSPALLDALRKVERVAPTDAAVLIVGETGSGKELFARAVHSRSRRAGRPLVKVNCGAIAPGLVESELFGHVKGAFTGAVDKRVGRFELAHGGTIFLDEIGELPPDAQVKLLRVLQEQEFEPVGSSRTVRVDVRVIAATNRNLAHAAREGRFRSDLLYRLDVFPIAVPPLRERPSDVSLLVDFFVSGLERRIGRRFRGFSAPSMERMQRYAWPGNVRELQNVIERAAILAHGRVIELEPGVLDVAPGSAAPMRLAAPGTLDEAQRTRILSALERTRGVIEGPSGAAILLGIHPNTLRSRMKKLGIGPGLHRES